MRALPSRPHAAAAVAAAAVGALRRGIGRRPRPASFDACQQQQRRALSATTGGGKDKDEGDDNKTTEAPTNETAHFNVVAAEARGDPSRRFTVSTDGQRRQKGAWVCGCLCGVGGVFADRSIG